MTTFTEKVEELLVNSLNDVVGDYAQKVAGERVSINIDNPEVKQALTNMLAPTQQALLKAHQAEISRRKEEWEKLRTQHEVGDIVGHYEITDRFKKVGKNTKYRVICKLCGAPMFRYSNRFKTNHKDCPAINKIKGEYNG